MSFVKLQIEKDEYIKQNSKHCNLQSHLILLTQKNPLGGKNLSFLLFLFIVFIALTFVPFNHILTNDIHRVFLYSNINLHAGSLLHSNGFLSSPS
jgi:hypothetical protein